MFYALFASNDFLIGNKVTTDAFLHEAHNQRILDETPNEKWPLQQCNIVGSHYQRIIHIRYNL